MARAAEPVPLPGSEWGGDSVVAVQIPGIGKTAVPASMAVAFGPVLDLDADEGVESLRATGKLPFTATLPGEKPVKVKLSFKDDGGLEPSPH